MSREFFRSNKSNFFQMCKACGTVYSVSISDVRVRSRRRNSPTFSCKCPFCKEISYIDFDKIPKSMLLELSQKHILNKKYVSK